MINAANSTLQQASEPLYCIGVNISHDADAARMMHAPMGVPFGTELVVGSKLICIDRTRGQDVFDNAR